MSEKMMTRVPNHSITVMREGKRVKAKSGKPFEFTPAEVKDLGDKVREPVNEGGNVPANAVSKKVANDFAKLVKAAEEAATAAKAAPTDNKLKQAAADAKGKVVEMAAATGLDVPDTLEEDI
jgi:hypothetical protein